MRTVIFDLDGTLADTSADLIAAANACFAALGHPPQLHPVRDAHTAFRGARAMLRLGFSRLGQGGEDLVDAHFPKLVTWYGENIDRHTRLYPGARTAVEALRAEGIATGICTNKPEALARKLIDRLGVAGHFAGIVGADTLPVRKPDPAPLIRAVELAGGTMDRCVLVGDTETDRATARAAGVPCALVTFGPDGEDVAALEPEALVPHFDQLRDRLRPLIG